MSDALAGAHWAPDLTRGSGPIYLRIVDELARARAAGILRPGDRLPAQRELARRLEIDLTTVTRAFTEARRRHLIDAAAGRGSFVTSRGEEEPILDLRMNIPPAPEGLSLPQLIRGGIDGLLRRSSAEALLSYHPGPGSPAERGAASLWLERSAGERLSEERVGVGAGAQALLSAVTACEAEPGDTVLADRLAYPGFIDISRALRLRLVGVEADADGMRSDHLERLARDHEARLVYLNPTLHNPTVLVMSEGRRREITEVSRRAGLTILEDDPYSPLLGEKAPKSFLALAPDRTYHVATLAKCISPFLRTAFLAAPTSEHLDKAARALRGFTLMAPPLMTSLAAEWVRSGVAGEIVSGVRKEVGRRQALVTDLLPGSGARETAAFHVWMNLPKGLKSASVIEAARARGLAVSDAVDFSITESAPQAIRIALGAVESHDKLADALERLAPMLQPPTAIQSAFV
ncbi:MAG: PLP-dependent aminotransferase family protein [Fulvimarina manganoxydans]|uniref:aminotransferase-like domain-containing protein n=1 Tax=Fulvimarina manganoxydans TaxID=937218 RepID=UPI0023561937|nr:PLP-dependent aminotransferase family protein [Fulvimarina manganoxydans]MCK5934846.1 PLP-dependent aminotransferase family protein [Fulvimarina manganoxydans]